MSELSRELRHLAWQIEEVCRNSPCASVAIECVKPCLDMLAMRARILELVENAENPPQRTAAGALPEVGCDG